jgi:hypothetical protein
MKPLAACLLLALAGCGTIAPGTFTTAGTSVHFKGQVCGQDADFSLSDMKDRSQATASVECPGGGAITISTADSSASAVMAQQAAMLAQVTNALASLATKLIAPAPGVAWQPAPSDFGPRVMRAIAAGDLPCSRQGCPWQ